MSKIIFILMMLPTIVLLNLGIIEQDTQKIVYDAIKNSADLAARDAALQVDWAASSDGHYKIDESLARIVFMEQFIATAGLDEELSSPMVNEPVVVDLTIVNYDHYDPLPKVVALPNGFQGRIDNSSVIAVIQYKKDSLIPGYGFHEARIEVVVQGQFRKEEHF